METTESPLTDISSSVSDGGFPPSNVDVSSFVLSSPFLATPSNDQEHRDDEAVSPYTPPMQGVEVHGAFVRNEFERQVPAATMTHPRFTMQSLQYQFFDAIHCLQLATLELQDFSDLHGEPGDDTFQPLQFRSQNYEDRLEHLRAQRQLREADVYTAALRLMHHSDFPAGEDAPVASRDAFPWRRHIPWHSSMRALRYTQRMLLEHAQATLLVLRHVGAEIHACRDNVDKM
ncbi:hypothetical protein Hypma_016619 [Hypsizygus marmoreus]|uniref:Uncharacterized protein n=1 Tax=Hypsizygus marmoreus TaxID=39966 RepID=A0A369J474_HYPMA|nr:hypothetical protein Hypma_016619 [Hypsizygus marmoreus]